MDMEKVTVIKIGGRAAASTDSLLALFCEMKKLNLPFIIVHGGGADVSKVSELFGIVPRFHDGIRLTSPPEMEVVDMVLAGKINKSMVRLFNTVAKGVGLSGSDGFLFTGESIDKDISRTGRITRVDTALLELLLKGRFVPIIASTSMDLAGGALNINADEAALHISAAIKASALLFISDIPGILEDNKVLPSLNEEAAEEAIRNGIISGGMIPKVRSSIEALKQGTGKVIIGEYSEEGDLSSLLSGKKGTMIYSNFSEGEPL